MTIIRAERIDLPSGSDAVGEGKLVERWRLTSDDRYDGPKIAKAYSGIPKLNAPWSINGREDPFFRCVDRDCEMVTNSPYISIITNHYSDKFDIQEMENKSKELQPLDRTPKVSRRYVEVEEPLEYDRITNELILNTAGERFIGLKGKRTQVVYDLEGYFGLDPQFLEIINGHMNKYQTTIYGRVWMARQLRFTLQSISPLQFEKGQYFYTVKAQLIGEDQPQGHDLKILNAGFREKDFFAGNKLRPCMINEERVTQPYPLDNGGYMIPAATLEANPDTAPLWLHVSRYPESDFAIIGLPPTTYQPES